MDDHNTPPIGEATEKAALVALLRRPSVRARNVVRVALAAAALAFVVFVASGPVSLAAPGTCAACHASRVAYAGWQASAHRSVGCAQCHADRASLLGVGNSFALASDVWRTATGGAASAPVRDGACLSCHSSDSLAKPVVVRGLRVSHKGLIEARYRCIDCHASVAHQVPAARLSVPTMSVCARCHNNVRASGRCTLCHSDARSADVARRTDPEWAKTHGSNWRLVHGMGDLSTCTLCHKSQECQQCHRVPLPHDAQFIANHGTQAKQAAQACLSCHRQSFCQNCHGIQIPHPAGFLARHSAVAKNEQDPLCARCHLRDDCSSCHIRHVHPNGPAVGK